MAPRLIAHLKSIAGIGADARPPQAGAFRRLVEDTEVELRLSTCPTVNGERIVLHVPTAGPPPLSQLGLAERDVERLASFLAHPGGLIVIGAPPRHGAHELLGALMMAAASPERNVVAVGRVPGATVAGINQCQTDPLAGFGYAEAMAAIDSQDADVIAIGDLREARTAWAALEAARGGAVVIAVMRAPDAAAAVGDLLAMGLAPWALAGTLSALVGVRTVRTLCEACRQPDELHERTLTALGLRGEEIDFPLYRPAGCSTCSRTGFRGRRMLCGVTEVAGALAAALRSDAAEPAARVVCAQALLDAGLAVLRSGQTSAGELLNALT